MFGFEAPLNFLDLESSRALVGAIELNRKEYLLVAQALHGNLGIDDVPWYSFWFGPWGPQKDFIFYFVFFGSILKV